MRYPLMIVLLSFLSPLAVAQEEKVSEQKDAPVSDIRKADIPKVTPEKPMDFWMKHKLDHSKTLLESLTMGDFKELAVTAGQMRLLGRIEQLTRRRNAKYRAQVKSFDRSLLDLIKRAEEKDTVGATLAFNKMTTSCVSCHALLRKGIE